MHTKDTIQDGYCKCGCGERVTKDRSFRQGHSNRVKSSVARPLADRFWEKVDKSSSPHGCWLWTASKYPDGYGVIRTPAGSRGAHRVSWELANGPVPDGLNVCHNCPGGDNPACVNPDHLFLGTQTENVKDMYTKGRDDKSRGSAHYKTHLTEDDVRYIRSVYTPRHREYGMTALAKRFGLSKPAMSHIVCGRSWRHVK